jgi:phosphoribosylglycinamide formyltransferase-1
MRALSTLPLCQGKHSHVILFPQLKPETWLYEETRSEGTQESLGLMDSMFPGFLIISDRSSFLFTLCHRRTACSHTALLRIEMRSVIHSATKACDGPASDSKTGAVTGKSKFRIGVLGSGKGSNFEAIADACATGLIPADVALVLSDVEGAGILDRARARKLPAQFISPGKFRTKLDEDSERAFVEALSAARVDLIVLAGFMRVLKGDFLRSFEGRIVNIHPSLLPSFPGLEAWKQALDYGVKFTGCTVHFVDAGVDSGPIIGQLTVPVLDTDTIETLHQRIHGAEHILYPKCVAAIARGGISVMGRRVVWKES